MVLSFRGSSRSDDAVAERLTIADRPWGTARIRRASMQRARRPRRPARTARRRARRRPAGPDARAGRDPPRHRIPVPRPQPRCHGRRPRPARRRGARRRDRPRARHRGHRGGDVRMGGRAGGRGALRRLHGHARPAAPGRTRRGAGPRAGEGAVPPARDRNTRVRDGRRPRRSRTRREGARPAGCAQDPPRGIRRQGAGGSARTGRRRAGVVAARGCAARPRVARAVRP